MFILMLSNANAFANNDMNKELEEDEIIETNKKTHTKEERLTCGRSCTFYGSCR